MAVSQSSLGTPEAVLVAALAVIVCFTAFLTAFRLAARAREGTVDGRTGWLFLASIAAGAGLWSGHTLLYAGIGEVAVFRASYMTLSLFLAIGTAGAGFAVAFGDRSASGPILAGGLTGIGLIMVDFVGLAALVGDQSIVVRPEGAAFAGAVIAIITGIGYAQAAPREGAGAPAYGRAAMLMAVAVTASNGLFVGFDALEGAPPQLVGPDAVGTQAVMLSVGAIMFLVIGSGMATALIDRDREYASQRRLRQLADASVEGLVVLSENKIVDVNESFLRIAGTTREEVKGMPFVGSMLMVDMADDALPPSTLWEGHLVVARNRTVPVEVIARPVEFDGAPCTVFAIRDLSDRQDAELRIRFLAEHDVLTGLPNRACFQRELEKRCAEVRNGLGRFSLFCVDLDRFKEANDVFGHLAGDAVLAQAAARIRDLIGPNAFAARLGGDEFVVMITDVQSSRLIADIADELVTVLSRPFHYNGQRIVVGGTVGIALAPHDGEKPELLLARADMALYRAKSQGRGSYCFFEQSMDEETRIRRTLAFELRDAIDRDQLELFYQPFADLPSNGIVGFEALVRWHHPEHGTISPTVFISIAEESGFIAQLGEWVLRTACHEASRWEKPLRVAVNLSPIQLEQQTLPEIVHEILIRTGLSPGRLELEVTESALMRNPQRALDVLRRLKALGVKIAMDDFGTGYSSLSTLQSFPFDKLKIDRSFVDRVGAQGQAESIVRAVVGLSRSLDIRVVAEGVETQSQIEFLAGEACDEVQGFMIGRPMPIASYRHLTRRGEQQPAPAKITA